VAQADTHDTLRNAESLDPEHAGVGHSEDGPQYFDNQGDHGIHHIPPSLYYKIFGALMILLFLTWGAAQIDLGRLNVPIALGIAILKAVLIILYFMHVRFSSRLIWLFSSAAFVFVGIMFFFAFLDYMTRPWFGMSR
jgi:cytochrome c oxidase subunit 4